MPAARRAALVVSVVAGACLALAGCSGSSTSSGGSGTPASGGVNIPAGSNTSSPAAAPTGSLSDLRKNGVPALNQMATYFDGLAAEAPAKAGQELRVIAADYKALAASIQSGNTGSLSKSVSQVQNLTTNGSSGTAFRQLITYMLTKCLGIS